MHDSIMLNLTVSQLNILREWIAGEMANNMVGWKQEALDNLFTQLETQHSNLLDDWKEKSSEHGGNYD